MSSWTRGDKFHICISYFQISYLQAKNRKLSRKDKCYEKDFEVKLTKMSKQIERNIKTSRKKINNLREEMEEKKKTKNIRLVQFVAGVTLYSFFSGSDAQWNGHHN